MTEKSQIVTGDALSVLRRISDNYIDCCVTSPPYYGLRDYGIDGQIGLEKTVDEYIYNLVGIFREIRRTLRPDGTLWINISDTYSQHSRMGGYVKRNANFQSVKGGVVLNDDNAESRRFVEHCYRTTSTMVNPIVDWTDEDVWEFLHHYGCQSNPLYQCGEKRIGCIGCPLQGFKGQKEDFVKYPGYRKMYVRAFDKMLEARNATGLV